MDNTEYLRSMFLGLSAEKMTAPVMTKEFQERQAKVLSTTEGRALAENLMAYKMQVLENIAFSTDTGRQVLAKYQADVENVFRVLEAGKAGQEATQRQDERIKELEDRVQSLMDELGATAKNNGGGQ